MTDGRALPKGSDDFFQLAESVPHVVWSADPGGRLFYCSRRGLEFLGAAEQEIRGISWARFVHPDDLPGVQEAWDESVRERTTYRKEQRLWSARDESWRWHLVEATPVPGENGDPERYYGVSTDIHDRKIAAEEREQLEMYIY